MNCTEWEGLLGARLRGELDGAQEAQVARHLATCEACRTAMAEAETGWQWLELLPAARPSDRMLERFYGLLASSHDQAWRTRPNWAWWPVAVAACVALVMGLALGRWSALAPAGRDVATLRDEVDQMRKLVVLSLLQQQSASERLKGVSWAYRAEDDDREVSSALLRTATEDSNVDVRLAAVEALAGFGHQAPVRRALAQSLGRQRSPLVQAAVIDIVGGWRDVQAGAALRALARDAGVDELVRQRARRVLGQLQE